MKKNIKRTLLAAVALSTVMANTLSASAASVKDIFNAQYYEEQYADLKTAFGDNKAALYNHYIQYGLSEKRNASPVLDVVAYREKYKDLDAAFGDNWDAYVNHYFTSGIKEHRSSGTNFDPIAYADKYPDIKAAFGDDYMAIINHYLNYGIAEGRTCDTVTVSNSTVASSESSSNSSHDNQPGNNDTDSNQLSFSHYTSNGRDFGEISMSHHINSGLSYQQIITSAWSDIYAVDSQGNSYPVSVDWSSTDFDGNAVGIYWVLGTVSATDGTTLPFKTPDILCSLHIWSNEDGFYGYYIFRELYGDTCCVKLTDENYTTTVYRGSDWRVAAGQLQVYTIDQDTNLRSTNIIWDCTNYDKDTPGTYTVTGTVTSDRFDNLPPVTATVTVSETALDTSKLQFYKYAWNEQGTTWLPYDESIGSYKVTYPASVGQGSFGPCTLYVQGIDPETGNIETYKTDFTFDTTNYDANAAVGVTQLLPVSTVKSLDGKTIPFNLPTLHLYATVTE